MYIVNYMKEILMPGVCVLSKHIHCRKNIYHIFQNKIREKVKAQFCRYIIDNLNTSNIF